MSVINWIGAGLLAVSFVLGILILLSNDNTVKLWIAFIASLCLGSGLYLLVAY